MNKLILRISFALALIGLQPLQAFIQSELKVRASAFIPTGKLFRNIYGKAAANFDIEFAKQLCNCLDAWINLDLFSKHGRSIGFCSPTKVFIGQVSFGLKVRYDITDGITLYAGIGPSFDAFVLTIDPQAIR